MSVRPHKGMVAKHSGAEGSREAPAALATQRRLEAKAAERAQWPIDRQPRAAVIAAAQEKPVSSYRRPAPPSVDLVAGLVCAAIALYYAVGLIGIFL